VPRYDELVIADEFEGHQARTGRRIVTAVEAQEIWDNGFTARRNRRGALDTRLLIGRTNSGREVTLVARHLGGGDWIAFTAWDTKEADWA
jgi:hypothetical protein